jgi:hypothetical protein
VETAFANKKINDWQYGFVKDIVERHKKFSGSGTGGVFLKTLKIPYHLKITMNTVSKQHPSIK